MSSRSAEYYREFPRNFEDAVYKSSDIATTKDITLPPTRDYDSGPFGLSHTLVPITLNKQHFPNLDYPPDLLIEPSTRSRAAQIGIHVEHINFPGDSGGQVPPEVWQKISNGESVVAQAYVINYAPHPIQIPAGTSLFRNFCRISGARLEEDSLIKALQDGRIRIDGTQGEDWEWCLWKNYQRIIGIHMKLDPEKRWYFPESDEPIRFPAGPNFRATIEAMMEPMPGTIDRKIFWVGQTKTALHLSKGIDAVVSDGAQIGHPAFDPDPEMLGLHTRSPLLDGGRTDWPIKVEEVGIPSSTNSVLLFFTTRP